MILAEQLAARIIEFTTQASTWAEKVVRYHGSHRIDVFKRSNAVLRKRIRMCDSAL